MGEGAMRVDLNADMGESFGRYRLGNDEALISHVTTVSLACGYHASDPQTMRSSVRLAKAHGVGAGAHISYPDLAGFGRRRMELSRDEVRDITVHQIGALLGFCLAEGLELQHVKPHGELFLTGVRDVETARGIVEGIASISKDLMLLMYGEIVQAECERAGIRLIHEAYIDLDYRPDRSLVLERSKLGRDPQDIAKRTVDLVKGQGRESIDGTWLDMPVESVCVHGDGPNAVEIAKAIRGALEAECIEVCGLRAIADSSQPAQG